MTDDETLIAEARTILHRVRTSSNDTLEGLTAYETAGMIERLASRLSEMQSDHAEAFAGKGVLSQAAFEELRGEWLPIESAPNTEVLLWLPGSDYDSPTCRVGYARSKYGTGSKLHGIKRFSATHWRPLPAPPRAILTPSESDQTPTCPDCGTSLHLVCLVCHPLRDDGGSVEVPKLDDEAQRRDVEAYLDGET